MLLDEAIKYAKYGWKVFPVKGKVPAIKGWKDEATSDPEKLKELFRMPHTGIGLATGKVSGYTVVDIDNKDGVNGFKTLENNNIIIDFTICFETPGGEGGLQCLYQYSDKIKNMVGALGDKSGIDIRNDGGLVILPPSTHPNGKAYQWKEGHAPGEIEVAPFPEKLLKSIKDAKPAYEQRARFNLPDKISNGQRNDMLFRFARSESAVGRSEDEILSAVARANHERCDVPLPEDEIVTIVKSAFGYGTVTVHKKGNDKVNSHQVVNTLIQQRRLIYCAAMFYEYMDGCYRQTDDQIVKQWIIESVGPRLSKGQAEEIIYFLQSKVFLPVESLNNTNLLNLKNGLLNSDTWTVLPHTPDIYSTIQLDVTFNMEAKCDLWLKTLYEIFPDADGDQKISILQEFFGVCLTKENKYEKALLLIGEGANGKSVILWVLLHLLKKENVSAIPLEKFDNHFYLINLLGKLANISIETNAKSEVYDSTFKAVVTGDPIQADQKFKPAILFNPFCKLVFATNNLPRVDDKSDAFFRRILILRFKKQFLETEQNKNLKHELLYELDGILIWCLKGLHRLRARTFFENPADMHKEIEDYRKENNSVIVFVEEVCELGPDKEMSKTELYSVFQKWCQVSGFKAIGKIKFGKELKRQLGDKISDSRVTDGDRIWVGIHLKSGWNMEFVNFIPVNEVYRAAGY
jgi:P4 family phage/plasmid primase-like protien